MVTLLRRWRKSGFHIQYQHKKMSVASCLNVAFSILSKRQSSPSIVRTT